MANKRNCRHCRTDFIPTHFNQHLCSESCKKERSKDLCKKWDQNNKDKKRAYNARKYAENGDYWRDNSFKQRYGISLDDAKSILESQGGRCAICRSPIDLHAKGINAPNKGHMDHCHYTGNLRGVLCRECNWGLGNLKDDIIRVRAAACYLEHYNAK